MTRSRALTIVALVMGVALAGAAPADAHTDSDLLAVPAGEEAVVKLKPTHGCAGSPTVEVAIRVPVAGARAVDVPGWTSTATADGEGRTVVEWKGGSLPSDEIGSFPVEFLAPDRTGELLLFPSVQVCENGDERSWIGGDPADEYPAPRLLVLPAGSAAATSIDDVPADAPGRAKLEAVVAASEAPGATTTAPATTTSTTPTPTDDPTTTSTQVLRIEPAAEVRDRSPRGEDEEGLSTPLLWGGAAATLAVILGGGLLLRRLGKD